MGKGHRQRLDARPGALTSPHHSVTPPPRHPVTPFRIAVVTPFLDKRHGTERHTAEAVERLARDYGYEVHIYSQRVEDVAQGQGAGAVGRIIWHKIPDIPGPYLGRYLWWFVANHLWRRWDRWVRGLRYDLTFSPGINCLDADVISVHIVFAEFYRQTRDELAFRRNPLRFWPRLLHRRLYYRMIIALERWVYRRPKVWLLPISRKVVDDLRRFYDSKGCISVVYHGVDPKQFHPEVRTRLRETARQALRLPADAFVLLLIGNDWKKKGLPCLLEAMGRLRDRRLRLLVVGRDDRAPFEAALARYELNDRVHFLPPRPDVEFYYAAADTYVAPSLEDAFALPVAEAMACGLPVIVSSHAGASEIVTDGVDGLILKDPRNPEELAALIRRVYEDPELRTRLASQAPRTALAYTWDRAAEALHRVLQEFIQARRGRIPDISD